ncbi:MAG: hypothetical protein H7269_07835 [Cellulomonas sp.]|nr:hypothetical protein [Cellulomonas sp.]
MRRAPIASALADNLSANVLGMGAATILRYRAFRRFAFAPLAIHSRGRRTHVEHSDPHTPALSGR